jgi:hypothetical protein
MVRKAQYRMFANRTRSRGVRSTVKDLGQRPLPSNMRNLLVMKRKMGLDHHVLQKCHFDTVNVSETSGNDSYGVDEKLVSAALCRQF